MRTYNNNNFFQDIIVSGTLVNYFINYDWAFRILPITVCD